MREYKVYISDKAIEQFDPLIQSMIKRYYRPYCFKLLKIPNQNGVVISCLGPQLISHDNVIRIEVVIKNNLVL